MPPVIPEIMTKTYEYFCKSGMRKRKLKTYVALVNADRAARRERGMRGIQRAALKKEMYMCAHFMLEQLKERFPEEDMRVYKLIRVVDFAF